MSAYDMTRGYLRLRHGWNGTMGQPVLTNEELAELGTEDLVTVICCQSRSNLVARATLALQERLYDAQRELKEAYSVGIGGEDSPDVVASVHELIGVLQSKIEHYDCTVCNDGYSAQPLHLTA